MNLANNNRGNAHTVQKLVSSSTQPLVKCSKNHTEDDQIVRQGTQERTDKLALTPAIRFPVIGHLGPFARFFAVWNTSLPPANEKDSNQSTAIATTKNQNRRTTEMLLLYAKP